MTELGKAVEAYIENPTNYLEYQDGWEDLSDLEYVEKAFKAGANWHYVVYELKKGIVMKLIDKSALVEEIKRLLDTQIIHELHTNYEH